MALQTSTQGQNRPERPPMPLSDLDLLLTAQIIIGWAGEGGVKEGVSRLCWWRTDLVSEFGGQDVLERLLPSTWEWSQLQAVREAAYRHDAEMRAKVHDPDRIVTLFSLGFEIDERAEERLMELKRSGVKPLVALPGLSDLVREEWDKDAFVVWLECQGEADFTPAPVGRRLKGTPPAALGETVRRLVAAFLPLSDEYPLPHFRRSA